MEAVTYVLGHKNPDTDSVVSAFAFAQLQNTLNRGNYVAARAGKLTPQTEFVFKNAGVTPPLFISDLTPKVQYYMSDDFTAIEENQSLQVASSLMQKNDFHFLAVTDSEGRYKSFLHYSVFARNLINSLNPEHHIRIFTNRHLIRQSLGALLACDASLVEKSSEFTECTIIVGATDFNSFKKTVDSRKDQSLIVITGDREDIQRYCIEKKVFCLIITGGRFVSPEVMKEARENGCCVLVSPFDTASTSLLAAYAVPVSRISDASVPAVRANETVSRAKNLLRKAPANVIPVVDDDNRIIGILSENYLHREPRISVSLVDHNELSQAVEGIENYTIKEIVDHHRIGSITTRYPVTFINVVLGSTATIIAGLYEETKVPVDRQTALLLLAGILSDTLILKSATATETDRKVAERLAGIAGVDIEKYGSEILSAGSRISDRTAEEIICQDLKEYTEGDITFTVSQIEVDSPAQILRRKDELLGELEKQRASRSAMFSALLITDITALDSFLLIDGDAGSEPLINFPVAEEHVYLLKDIVSRKKQLIPLLTELISRL